MINREVQIFTNGACQGDRRPGRWGFLLSSGETEKEIWGSDSGTTNNRMKLTSVIREIEALNQASITVLTTDSRYVYKGVTQWIKGWKDASEQPVKNQDLWGRLGELCETRKVDFRWVKYRDGHLANERANALANCGMYELGEGGCDK